MHCLIFFFDVLFLFFSFFFNGKFGGPESGPEWGPERGSMFCLHPHAPSLHQQLMLVLCFYRVIETQF